MLALELALVVVNSPTSCKPPIAPVAVVVSVLDPLAPVAEADKVFTSIDRLSESVVAPVSWTIIATSALFKVPVTLPVVFCELPKAKVGAAVPPIDAAVPVIVVVPEMPEAMAVSKLLLLSTVLSVVVPACVFTEASVVVAVTLPEFV